MSLAKRTVPFLTQLAKDALPVLAIAFIAAVIAGWITVFDRGPQPYEPLEAYNIEILSDGPYAPGSPLEFKNGVCNTAQENISALLTLGLQQEAADPLLASHFLVVSGRSVPFAPGECVGREAVTGPVPPVPPGRWRIYASLVVMGSQSGQRQQITLLSDYFEVTPPE